MGVVIITFFIFNEFLYVNGDANYVTGHDVSVDNILEISNMFMNEIYLF